MPDKDIESYIHDYKSKLLEQKDEEKSQALESANKLDTGFASQFMFLSSVLLTVISGFIASKNFSIDNDGAKVLITATIIFLFASLFTGLVDHYLNAKFFAKWGKHLHKQGATILNDKSKDITELEALRDRLQESTDSMPTKSPELFRVLQITFFLIGVLFLLVLIVLKIYT